MKKVSSKIGNNETRDTFRMEYFKLEKAKLKILIAKMRKNTNGAKLGSVLSTATAFCLRRLYDKYQVDDIDKIDLMRIKIVASLRDKFEITNHQMGVYTVMLNVQDYVTDLNESNFWEHVERKSKDLHKRLDNNEDIEQPGSQNDKEFIKKLNEDFDFSKFTSHDFLFSNIGIMEGNSKSDVIACDDFLSLFKTFLDESS